MNTLEKIYKVLNKVEDFKNKTIISPDKNLTRQEYKQKYNLESEFNFALTAKTIIEKNIPIHIIGCTGLVKLFAYYAKDNNLDCNIIFTANLKDLQNKAKRINGHQIISVKLENNKEIIFDPQNTSKLQEINLQKYIVNNITHIFTGKIFRDKIETINTLAKIEKIYKDGYKNFIMKQGIEKLKNNKDKIKTSPVINKENSK